jgi:undecaprenyl pyrophosphate synthase
MNIETRLKEVLKDLAQKKVNQNGQFAFFTEDWKGTKEELNDYKYCLQELKKRGDIELQSELTGDGEFYQIKITPKGYMSLKEQH